MRSTSQQPLTRLSWHHGRFGFLLIQILHPGLPAPDAQPSQPGTLLQATTPVTFVNETVACPPAVRRKAMCLELFDVIDAHWVSRTSCSGALSQVGTVESQSYVEPAATSDVDQLRPYGAGVGLWPAVGAAEATETAAVSNNPDSRAAPTSDRRRFFATLPFMEHQP